MRNLLIFLIIGFISCEKSDFRIEAIFDTDELKTQNEIISFLDSVVVDYTGIENYKKSYPMYLDSCFKAGEQFGGAIYYGINDMDKFLKSLNQVHLKEYYNIEDSITYRYPPIHPKNGETIIITDAYQKSINIRGKYIKLLEILKEDNKILKEYHNNLLAAGDLLSSHYLLISKNCSDLDMKNKYHRLIVAITIFASNKDIYQQLTQK